MRNGRTHLFQSNSSSGVVVLLLLLLLLLRCCGNELRETIQIQMKCRGLGRECRCEDVTPFGI